MFFGLGCLVITFGLYVFGVIPSAIPLTEVSKYWSQDAHSYLAAINRDFLHLEHPPIGWTWITLLKKGDFLNFLSIALLAGLTIFCYLAIIPSLFKKKDVIYGLMTIVEIMILGLAASGILAVGGH
ncbi:DUF1634 domain-containing protein [Candidatus Desantisbacteria bacterium]|nr:DUF1634 domain-containing protein [Candidatus Desantisbacteria bacterium]